MKQRLMMTFDGWAAQFENIPSWRPEICIKKDCLYMDEYCVATTFEKIVGVAINIDSVTIFIENKETGKEKNCVVYIEWPFNKEPYIENVFVYL